MSNESRHPTPAADEVEAVARAIQDAHAPGHPINHVSIYQARAAIAAMHARSAEPVGEAKAIIDELNACYLYGVSEKSDALAKRIIAHLSRPSEPAGEEPVAWRRWNASASFFNVHYLGPVDHAQNPLPAGWRETPLYARPATPTNPERLVEAEGIETVDEDWLTDVIDDSIDMDWTGRVGAKAIMRELAKLQEQRIEAKVCHVCGAKGREDHAGHCSESW